jgi:hypothetical protein
LIESKTRQRVNSLRQNESLHHVKDVDYLYRELGYGTLTRTLTLPERLGALVNEVGRKAEYAVFYSAWSEAMHSSNYADHVRFEKGKVTFRAIRHLSG